MSEECLASSDWQVPSYTEQVLSAKKTNYCLVIPVINEGERIRTVLQEMSDLNIASKVDIIIADGGSIDGSLDAQFLISMNVCTLLTKTDSGKLSAQLRMAYAWALQHDYAGIITIDGNGKDSINSIPLFIKALEDGIDYAQSSRFIYGGKNINTPLMRVLAIRLIHVPCMSLAARHWFTDTTQGFRAYSRRYLLDERVKPFRKCFQQYELLAYLTVRATQCGFRVCEVATTRTYPVSGAIPTKIRPVHGSIELLQTLFSACFGRYKP